MVCGTGGVGKTTVSASLALAAARSGQRVLVMTIDPARRLATALGIDKNLSEATSIPLLWKPSGDLKQEKPGSLDAMMLDAKSTWDGVVRRFAPSQQIRERILSNRYYQKAAGSLAGSQEYMAMEKLLEMVGSQNYDLIVLDTPPTRNALDFMEAPQRMMAVLQDSILRWIAPNEGSFSSARAGAYLFGRGQQAMFSLFERFIGSNVLKGISEFIRAFSTLTEGMRSRADEVAQLLASENAAFVLVASPSQSSLDEALYFHDRLQQADISVRALIVNRTHSMQGAPVGEAPASAREAGFAAPPETDKAALLHSLWNHYQQERAQQLADERSIRSIQAHCGYQLPLLCLPNLGEQLHDLEGLHQLAGLLSQEQPEA